MAFLLICNLAFSLALNYKNNIQSESLYFCFKDKTCFGFGLSLLLLPIDIKDFVYTDVVFVNSPIEF